MCVCVLFSIEDEIVAPKSKVKKDCVLTATNSLAASFELFDVVARISPVLRLIVVRSAGEQP